MCLAQDTLNLSCVSVIDVSRCMRQQPSSRLDSHSSAQQCFGRGGACLQVLYGFRDERVELLSMARFFRLVCEQSSQHPHAQEKDGEKKGRWKRGREERKNRGREGGRKESIWDKRQRKQRVMSEE